MAFSGTPAKQKKKNNATPLVNKLGPLKFTTTATAQYNT